MKRRNWKMSRRWLAVLLALAVALPALAGPRPPKDSKSAVKTTVTLSTQSTFGSTSLKPGEYSLVADESKATLSQNGKVVAEANARWMDAPEKFRVTAVVLDNNKVKEIRLGGQSRYLSFD
jgi:hypothetical protein